MNDVSRDQSASLVSLPQGCLKLVWEASQGVKLAGVLAPVYKHLKGSHALADFSARLRTGGVSLASTLDT